MRRLVVILALLVAVAVGCGSNAPQPTSLATASVPRAAVVPGLLERGRWLCTERSARPACAGPAKSGFGYLYVLRTHCGILDAYFAGRLWRANPALTDGSGNPPRGWANPEALGTMRLVRTNLAEFRTQDQKLVARFRPAPRHSTIVTCE